jgi:hypothetical protein
MIPCKLILRSIKTFRLRKILIDRLGFYCPRSMYSDNDIVVSNGESESKQRKEKELKIPEQ